MRIESARPTVSEYMLVIIVTLVGFIGLAALLLVPVYRFLKREEKMGEKWTDDHVDPSSERQESWRARGGSPDAQE